MHCPVVLSLLGCFSRVHGLFSFYLNPFMPSWSITKGTVIVGRWGAKIISISLTTVSRGPCALSCCIVTVLLVLDNIMRVVTWLDQDNPSDGISCLPSSFIELVTY